MAADRKPAANAMEIDRLATQLAKDPYSKAFLPLAEEYCKVGMLEEAVAVLEDGLKHYPGYITAMVTLGRAYNQLNQSSKARAVLEGAIQLSPDNLLAHRTLIKIYTAENMIEEALKSCRVILATNPRDEEALSAQALLSLPNQIGHETRHEALPVLATKANFKGLASAHSSIPAAGTIMQETLQGSESGREGHQRAQDLPLESSVRVGKPSPRVLAIAKLESWLRSIQQRRRDREGSEDASL
ncbi:tetratricopeptide repeat protein [Petrachloros mirabilis]